MGLFNFVGSVFGKNKNDAEAQLIALDNHYQMEAINRSLAVIEFSMDGTILQANDNFLGVMGYTLSEVQGKHHRIFVEDALANSREYRELWEALNRGEFQSSQFKRISKKGQEIWIQASYNPILGLDGKPVKIVKYASDITEQTLKTNDYEGQLAAINRSQAVIEFNLDGTIITANENFLAAMGYSLDEVRGKHHSIFVPEDMVKSSDYREFWALLNRGEYQSREFRRIAKGGKEIWIQASYNPIFNTNGNPLKIVKYATDITEQKLLRQSIDNMFTELADLVNALAEGNLGERVTGSYEGEFEALKNTVNGYCESLTSIVNNIKNSAKAVMQDAGQIKNGNASLSRGTESQAASVEETAASMEEMTSAVKANANSVREANVLAANARERAEEGGTVARDAVSSMAEITSSSKRISDIISVIDEIAFQTNLLALNAAVEAARAGDQGRGFAVVASEVRTLAGRSAEAAKEIKELIEHSVAMVEEGNELVSKSGESLERIVDSIAQVTDIFSSIEVASDEQAQGIDQVNQSISQIDAVTQKNVAMVGEVANASSSLRDQAENLIQQVEFFSLEQRDSSNRSGEESNTALRAV